jgi:hypothetical protein
MVIHKLFGNSSKPSPRNEDHEKTPYDEDGATKQHPETRRVKKAADKGNTVFIVGSLELNPL